MATRKEDTVDVDVVDPTTVGFFEAENIDASKTDKLQKKRKLFKLHAIALKGVSLPEQGSWHLDRKKQIIKAHPEIKQLYGTNPWSLLFLIISATCHLSTAAWLVDKSWLTMFVVSYTFGALFSWQCATLAHEGAHGNVYKSRLFNKLFAFVAFLPVFAGPFGNFWCIEHMYHHQVVIDKSQRYGPQSNGPIKKFLFSLLFIPYVYIVFAVGSMFLAVSCVFTLPLYYLGMRANPYPVKTKVPIYEWFPQIVNEWFIFNTILSLVFQVALYLTWGWTPLIYMYLSTGFSNGFHPLGMRQVQEHYLQRKDQPTNSVYSSWDPLFFCLGYHVEHHDFPTIPWTRLHKVREIAPEFYNNLFYYNSYMQVMYEFLFNPGISPLVLLEDTNEALEATIDTKKNQ